VEEESMEGEGTVALCLLLDFPAGL
jgi:hypothetical protein